MPATWFADVLRAAGLEVNETLVPDWKQRGHTDGPFAPVGVMGHHTAGGSGDLPSLATVRDGRTDLAGPLANLMLSRSGVWVPIAAGRCWHAGAADNRAAWPWVPNGDGNGYLIGIEAESSGTGDWTDAQKAAYPRGVAALLAHLGAGPDRFLGHLEWAPSRKIDPAGWPGGMNGFRQSVASGGDDMFSDQDRQALNDLHQMMDAFKGGAEAPAYQPFFLSAAVKGTTDALRSEGVSGAGDVGRLVDALAAKLSTGTPGTLTREDVAAAVREVFADAAKTAA